MWEKILDSLPSFKGYLTTVAAFAIPFVVYKLNQKLHQIGDPPWKKSSEENRGK